MITEEVKLYLNADSFYTQITAKQGDKKSRYVEGPLYYNNVPYTPPAGSIIIVSISKPDGTKVITSSADTNPTVSLSGTRVTFELTEQMLGAHGNAVGDVAVVNGDSILSSANIKLKILPKAVSDEAVESSDEYNVLAKALDDVKNLDANYAPRLVEVESSLATTVTQVQSLSSQVQGFYATVALLTTAFPTGNTNNYTITADGYIYRWNGTTWASTGYLFNGASIATESVKETSLKKQNNDLNIQDRILTKLNPTVQPTDFNCSTSTAAVTNGTVVISKDTAISQWYGATARKAVFETPSTIEYIAISDTSTYFLAIANNAGNFGKLIRTTKASNSFSFSASAVLTGSYVANAKWRLTRIDNRTVKVERDIYDGNKFVTLGTININTEFSGAFTDVTFGATTNSGTIASMTFKLNRADLLDNISKSASKWNNKKWLVTGDSISNSAYAYQYKIAEELGLIITNSNKSGSSLARLYPTNTDAFCVRVDTLLTGGYDLITIFGGTNDFGHSIPIGVDGSVSLDDMTGALNHTLTSLRTAYPQAIILFIIPLQRNYQSTGADGETTGLGPNTQGKYLIDYIERIKKICEQYSVDIVDLYGKSGLTKFNSSIYTSDGLHPNTYFMNDVIAPMIKDAIIEKYQCAI